MSIDKEKKELLSLLLKEQGIDISQIDKPLVRKREKNVPLSFSQQRLWFLDQLEPGNAAYNIFTAYSIKGLLNVSALERSIQEIIRRHEILRTRFISSDGEPVQVIDSEWRAPLQVIDLRLFSKSEQKQVQQLAEEEALRRFDLSHGPLVRSTLLKLSEYDHVIFFTMHHIISDGWSIEIFNRELTAIYEAFCMRKEPVIPDLALQYADFTIWQRNRLEKGMVNDHLTYWEKQLSGDIPVLQLPVDRLRPPLQTYKGATVSFQIPRSIAGDLKNLSRLRDSTLFMTLFAAFNVLLFRYTGQKDILVGTPVAGRDMPEFERLIGFFVNTLALRTDLSGDPAFLTLLDQVREISLAAWTHSEAPFEYLVEHIQPARNLSHSPLFQVMFALQNYPSVPLELPGLEIQPISIKRKTSKFDLTLFMEEKDEGLKGIMEYNTDLFDASTIERMTGHFQVLLNSIVENPNQWISELPILTKEEYNKIIIEFNKTKKNYGMTKKNFHHSSFIIHHFEDQVRKNPDAVALIFEQEQLTYAELNDRANQLSRYLNELGVGLESRVGVYLERSIEMIVGLYAILKAGGAYVPLDPTYPVERTEFMMADSNPAVVLTSAKLVETMPHPSSKSKVLVLDRNAHSIFQRKDGAGNRDGLERILWDNLAYVIYTSGSTGRPKGTMNTHGAILNRLLWMQEAFQLTPDDRVLQKTPFSFDVSVWEFFWPLMTGACLVVVKPEGHKDSTYLANLIKEQQITTLHFVPSMLSAFLTEPDLSGCKCLKRVILSGEALSVELQERFFERLNVPLYNLYGPTEAAVDVTWWHCKREQTRHTVPIGYPIANIQMYILDEHFMPVPIGVAGELYIAGVGLGRGYLNRPDLTAEKFVPCPFGSHGDRMYKTGDLSRYLPDGSIEYLGRLDHQVKIRGFRIELGEIEAVLNQHAGIHESVVMSHKGAEGDRLVAWLTLKTLPTDPFSLKSYGGLAGLPSVSELRDYLKTKIPEYMIPSAFVIMDTMPLMPNGKVDRRALPNIDTARPDLTVKFTAPRNHAEQKLAHIWEELLDIRPVGISDNFFDLGGHSLLIVRLAAEIHKIFGIKLPLADLFKAGTIEQMAELIK